MVPILALLASCQGVAPTVVSPAEKRIEVAASHEAVSPVRIEVRQDTRSELASAPDLDRAPSGASVRGAPTWSGIFAQYFAVGTEGGCGRSSACHAPYMAHASSAYEWLEKRGYIAGTQSPIASESNSCLRWFGGNMPPRGKENTQAARELSAWVAAGAPND